MRRRLVVVVAVVLALGMMAGVAAGEEFECTFPYETPDGQVVEEEPETVAPGIASVSQTLWELGAQDKVVGLTTNSFYLEDSDEFDDLGTTFPAGDEYAENVIDRNPDLVVNALFEPEGLRQTFEDAGIGYVFVPQSGGFEEIQQKVRIIANSIGECEEGERVVDEMQETIDRVESSVAGEDEPLVMFGTPTTDPGEFDNFVPGNGTFKHDIITTAGGENVYDRIGVEGPQEVQISGEETVLVLDEDPDWIVVTDISGGVPATDEYNETTAVQEDQILTVDNNYINQDAPRVVIPLERMARAFHPNAFTEETTRIGGGGGGSLPQPDTGEVGDEGVTERISVTDGISRADFGVGVVETVEFDGEFEGDVSVTQVEVGDAPGTPLHRVSIDVPEAARGTSGSVSMRVSASVLEETGVPVDDLVVVRDDDGWSALETNALETDDGATVVAEVPGFSDFAVVASTPPTASAEASHDEDGVTLDASGSSDEYGEVVSYVWEVDGETHEGETVTVELDDGDYDATVTVTNDVGFEDDATVGFSVEDGEEVDDADDATDETEETADDDVADEADEEGLPGFTAVAALVALASVLALGARRD